MYKEQINVAKSVNGKPVQPTRSQLAYKVVHLLKKFIVSRKPVCACCVTSKRLIHPAHFLFHPRTEIARVKTSDRAFGA